MASIQYGKYGRAGRETPPDTFLYNAATLAANTAATALQSEAKNFGIDLEPLGIKQHELTQDWAKQINPFTNAGANFLYGTGTQMLMSQAGGMMGNTSMPVMDSTPNPNMRNGGTLNQFNGLPHELGGIPVSGNNEVEDKETMFKDYVFSNNLMYDENKSFADVSKKVYKKYKLREGDPWTKRTIDRELSSLKEKQEQFKQVNNIDNSQQFAVGGGLPKPIVPKTLGINDSWNWNNSINPSNTLMNQMNGNYSFNYPTNSIPGIPITYDNVFPLNLNTTPDFKTTPKSDTLMGQIGGNYKIGNYAKAKNTPNNEQENNVLGNLLQSEYTLPMMGYALQGLSNIPLLTAKPEYAKYDRITPNLVDYSKSRDSLNRNKYAALSMNMRNPLNSSAQSINAAISNILGTYGDEYNKSIEAQLNANSQILNAVAAQNAEIQMKETEANQMERDAVRSAKYQGYSNLGQVGVAAGNTIQDINQYNNYMDFLKYSNPYYTIVKDSKGKDMNVRLYPDADGRRYYIKDKKKFYID